MKLLICYIFSQLSISSTKNNLKKDFFSVVKSYENKEVEWLHEDVIDFVNVPMNEKKWKDYGSTYYDCKAFRAYLGIKLSNTTVYFLG